MLIAEIIPLEDDTWIVSVWDDEDKEATELRTHGPYATMDLATEAAMQCEPYARIW